MIPVFLVGIFVGACGVLGSQLLAGRLEPLHMSWRPLPDRLETLNRWGRLGSEFNPARIGARTAVRLTALTARQPVLQPDDVEVLPIRIPGAALIDVPSEDIALHTMRVDRRGWRPWDWAVRAWWNLLNRYSILESDDSFRAWWEDTWYQSWPVAMPGRHRHAELTRDPKWRNRWASYDTQGWPTLATVGNAWEIRAQDVRPTICTMNMATISPSSSTLLRVLSSSHSQRDSQLVSSAT